MKINSLSLIFVYSVLTLFQVIRFQLSSPSFSLHLDAIRDQVSLTEGKFALGSTVPLSSCDMYDLELIPGVSDKLAISLIASREKIVTAAKANLLPNSASPFVLAHGVGEKTAKKLEKYLTPE